MGVGEEVAAVVGFGVGGAVAVGVGVEVTFVVGTGVEVAVGVGAVESTYCQLINFWIRLLTVSNCGNDHKWLLYSIL